MMDAAHWQARWEAVLPWEVARAQAADERRRLVVRGRDVGLTYKEIGKRLGLSVERIRQMSCRYYREQWGGDGLTPIERYFKRNDAAIIMTGEKTMATALAKKTGTAVATERAHNPYKELATAVSPKNIYGELLKFSKGDWVAGEHATEIPRGTLLVAIMDKLCTGWVRWENQRPTEQQMIEVEQGKPPRRTELGDNDKSLWELDDKGQPRDPWQFTMYLPLISEDGKPYTFAASSKGGINAIGKLSGEYGDFIETSDKPVYPVVSLGVDSYMHPNKAYGKIKIPTLEVDDYVLQTKYQGKIEAALHGGPDKGQPDESENPGDGLDDEIPF